MEGTHKYYWDTSDEEDYCQKLLDHTYGHLKNYTYTKTNTKVDFYSLRKGGVYIRPKGTDPVIVTDRDDYDGSLGVLYFNGNTGKLKPQFMWATRNHKIRNESTIETKEENMTNTTKLYQIIGTETYGTHIATNSKGAYVLEMKGTGEVVTKGKKELEEVVPYTISLKFLSGGNRQEYAYFSKEGDVSVGDLVIVNGGMGKITAVNTRSPTATKDLEGTVVVTKKIGE